MSEWFDSIDLDTYLIRDYPEVVELGKHLFQEVMERHKDEIDLCNQTISVLQSGDVESSRASLLLWGSAIKRHSEDIVGIDLLIAKVERKFNV